MSINNSKSIALVGIGLLLLLLTASNDRASINKNGYSTPEEVVTAYLEAFRDSDISRMMDTFMTERLMEHYDLKASILEIGEFRAELMIPNANEFISTMSLEQYRGGTASMITGQYHALCAFESNLESIPNLQTVINESDVKTIINQMSMIANSLDFGTLKVSGFITPESLSSLYDLIGFDSLFDHYLDGSIPEQYDITAKSVGADKKANCIAVFEINGNHYMQCFEVFEYNGDWRIAQLGGLLYSALSSTLRYNSDSQGLIPLFPISDYSVLDNGAIMELRNETLKIMKKVKKQSTRPVPDISTSTSYQGPGFDTPEDAVKAYLEGLRDADLNRMLSAFAIESIADNYDLEAALRYYKFYFKSLGLPNVNAFITSLQVEEYKLEAINSIVRQYLLICFAESGQVFPENQKIRSESDASAVAALVDEVLNAPKLSTLSIISHIPLEDFSILSPVLGGIELSDSYFTEEAQSMFDNRSRIKGANKTVDCLTAFEINGNAYLLCLEAIEYDGKWRINQLGGNLASWLDIPYSLSGMVPLSFWDADAGIDADRLRELIISMG